jgi:DNA polymerase III subunit delta'
MTFDSFIGNRKIIDRLRKKLREGRFPHGLIFSGPEGVGKHTSAIMIAKTLNCPNAPSADAFCNECTSCRKIEAGTHPDVQTISVEEDASQIKIAQVRQVLSMLDLQPLEGRNKVFIIDPADKMNPEAANALLKGLEEPPENSFFILITVNVHELLLTVRSRSQVYNFTPLAVDEIRQHGVSDELVARWSEGSIGHARNLDISRLKSERELMLDFLEISITANEEQFQDLLGVSADLGRAKQGFEERMKILAMLLADVIYLQEGLTEKLVNIDIRDRLLKLANRASLDRIVQMSDFLGFIESSLKSHVNRQMLMDMLALTGNEILNDFLSESR